MKALITSAIEDAGVVAARSLAAAGFSVHGVDHRNLPRYVRPRTLSSYQSLASFDDHERDQRLIELIGRVRPHVYLPLGTRGTIAAIRNRGTIASTSALNIVDKDGFLAAYDKASCKRECAQLGIPCAAAYSIDEASAELARAPGVAAFVVKPRWDVGGASGVHYVHDAVELRAAVGACSARYGGFLIEEFIPGDASAMKTVLLLFAGNARLAAAFTSQKIRHWPQTGGPTAASRSTAEHELVELVLPFFEKWRWRGPAEVELKLDARDGRHKVIEINPRFAGYLRFPWHCGLDLPLLAVRLALGETPAQGVPLPAYRTGETYVAPTFFFRTLRDDVHTAGLRAAIVKALHDARGGASVALGMLADPLPLLARAMSPPPGSGQSALELLDGMIDS